MGMIVKINGVDRTEYADAKTLKINDEITDKVNTASFDFICNDIAVAPKPGETILIEENSTKLFSGRILSKDESFLPPNLLKYSVECIDHTRDLDRKLVAETYVEQLAGNIIKDIVTKYTSGFTTTNVADGPTISEIAFDFVQMSDAITKIAEICGYEWYIDYEKDVHFFDSSLNPAPFQLDDDQANYKDLILDKDISQLRNRIYIKSSAIKDTFGEVFIGDGVATSWVCKYRAEIMLPTALDTDSLRWRGNAVEFSNSDTYLAVGLQWVFTMPDCPDIRIFKRDGDTFTKIDNPDTLPTGNVFGVAWSSDDVYLAAGHEHSPRITIWKRDEDVFTKLDNPAILPTGDGNGLDFGYNDIYLAIAHKVTPYITIYKRAADVFTKLDNPSTLPTGTGYDAAFSPNGTYLAVVHATTPYITIYKRSNDTFTKLTNPADLPIGNALDVAFSPDGIYLAVGHTSSPFITIYKRFGDTFTKLTNPADLPTGCVTGVAFAPNSTHLATAHENSPYMTLYKRGGDTFVKMDDPSPLPTGDGLSVAFSYGNIYLAVGHKTDPRLTIYKHFVPLIMVDGIYKTVGWDGIDNPNYFDYMLNPDTKLLSIGTAGNPPIDIGSPAIERVGSILKNYTHIAKENPANASGKITKIEIFAYENLLNTIVVIFTQVAENVFTARASQAIGTVISGSKQTFSVDLEVAEGDFIGIYFTSGRCMMDTTGVGRWSLYGDHTSCSEATFNFTADRTISLYGTGSTEEGELGIGTELLIIYTTYGRSICFRRDDKASIIDRQEKEGGDGIIEFCLVDNNINSMAWGNNAAKADLLQNSNPTIEATFLTNRGDVRSGQIITLNSIKRNINQQFIVQKVELIRVDTDEETTIYVYQVTIANKFKKLEDLFLHLLTKADVSLVGGAAAPGGGAVGDGGATTFLGLTDTPANYAGSANKFAKVNAGETALEFATPTIENNVTKTGAFTAGRIARIYDNTGIIDQGTVTDNDVADAVAKKHSSGSETLVGDVGGTVGANAVNKIKGHIVDEAAIANDKILVYKTTGDKYVYEAKPAAGSTTFLGLTDTPANYAGHGLEITQVNAGANSIEFSGKIIDQVLTDDENDVPTSHAVYYFCETTKNYALNSELHTQNTDTQLNFYNALASDHTYSGLVDTQLVGEAVSFGKLLYFNWTYKKWKLTDADFAGCMPGLRIALESKTDGQTCLMLVKGYIRDDSWNFTAPMVYVTTAYGSIFSIAPSGTGDQIQRVGVAKSADILFFDPSIDVGEI